MTNIDKRPLGTNEKVFWVLDQITTTHFAVVAEIDGNTTEMAWRQALDIVQKRHPNLSAKISGNAYANAHFESVAHCQIPLRFVLLKEAKIGIVSLKKNCGCRLIILLPRSPEPY